MARDCGVGLWGDRYGDKASPVSCIRSGCEQPPAGGLLITTIRGLEGRPCPGFDYRAQQLRGDDVSLSCSRQNRWLDE